MKLSGNKIMDLIGKRLMKYVLTTPSRSFSSRGHPSGDITRHNFWCALDSFKTQIQSADFVAIDLELSGVQCVIRSDNFATDSSAEERCYRKLKDVAEKFAVLQVGVALFEWNMLRNKFLAYPYNFYLFPRNELQLELPGPSFSCAASSLEFLVSHGFDFNLCFQDGISYLSKMQEAEARHQMVNLSGPSHVEPARCTASLSSTSDVIFYEKLRIAIGRWYKKLASCNLDQKSFGDKEFHVVKTFADISRIVSVDELKDKTSAVSHAEELSVCRSLNPLPSFTLLLENQHQFHLAQLVVDKNFQDLALAIRTSSVSDSPFKITIMFKRSRVASSLKESDRCTKDLIEKAIGFRHVIDAIITSRKPLVGHNCALDVAHIYSKFLAPLPESVTEFSASILNHFPSIIDTKYLIKFEQSLRASWARRHTSLSAVHSHLFKPKDINVGAARFARSFFQLSQKVEIEIATGFKRYQDTENRALHEAGYDAFMTGSIFAQICRILNVDIKNLQSLSLDEIEVSGIARCINVLNFGRMVLDLRARKERAGAEKGEASNRHSEQPNCIEGQRKVSLIS